MVQAKHGNDKKKKILLLAIHSIIQAVVAYVVVAQWNNWYLPIVIFVTHLLIDRWKSLRRDTVLYFVIDQCLHLLVIIALWLFISEQFTSLGEWIELTLSKPRLWLIVIAYLLMLKPSSILISLFIKRWNPDVKSKKDERVLTAEESETLQKAGQWIGYLERLIILTFMLTDSITAVGFLFAAKSIFRIGDLRPGHNLKLTEYVLIGTFTSFFIAIIAGIIL